MKPNEGIKTETREYIQIVVLERLNNKLIVKLDFLENISKFFLADKFVAEYDKTIEDVIGKKAEDCEYCRFSPIHLKDNQTSPKLVKERQLLGMLDWRKNVLDYIHTTKDRRATAKYYLRWANISKSAKDYKSATKYILKSFFLNPEALPLLGIPFLTEKVVKRIRKSKRILKKFKEDFDL